MHVDEIRKIQHEAESIEACVSQAPANLQEAVQGLADLVSRLCKELLELKEGS